MSFCAEASVAEEPGAENPHAGIRAGGVEQSASLLRSGEHKKKEAQMYNKLIYVILLWTALSCIVFGQKVIIAPVVNQVSIGVDLYYYHPKIDELNSSFSHMESNLGLPGWKDFNISYLVIPRITYEIDQRSQVSIQSGASYFTRFWNENKSYYYLFFIGGEYRYLAFITPSSAKYPIELALSLGGGMLTSKFFRSYGQDRNIFAFGSKPYFDGGVALSYATIKQLNINLDLRYLFVPTMNYKNLSSEVKLSSLLFGIGVLYSL